MYIGLWLNRLRLRPNCGARKKEWMVYVRHLLVLAPKMYLNQLCVMTFEAMTVIQIHYRAMILILFHLASQWSFGQEIVVPLLNFTVSSGKC